MNDSIWQSIAATPWWAYAFIMYLFYSAYQRSKPQVVSVHSMFFVTSLSILVSAAGILIFVKLNLTNIVWWLSMNILGLGCGWLHLIYVKAKLVKDSRQLFIPGSWAIMIAVIIALASKYYIGYEISIDFNMLLSGHYSTILMALYGLVMGLSLGRMAYTLRIEKHGPYITADALPAH